MTIIVLNNNFKKNSINTLNYYKHPNPLQYKNILNPAELQYNGQTNKKPCYRQAYGTKIIS